MAIATSTNGYLTRTTDTPTGAAGYTWCAWVRITGNATNFDCIWAIELNESNYISLNVASGGRQITAFSANGLNTAIVTPDANAWLFIALKQTGSTTIRVLYRTEGATSLSDSGNLTCQTPESTWMQTLLNDDFGELGQVVQMQAFKQWNAVLTDAELWEESVRLLPKRRANIDSYLPLYGASSTDEGGLKRNWTVNGSPVAVAAQPRISRGGGGGQLTVTSTQQTITLGGAASEQESLGAPAVGLRAAQGALAEQESAGAPTLHLAVLEGTTGEAESVASPGVALQLAQGATSEPEALNGPTLHQALTQGALAEQEAAAGPSVLLLDAIAPSTASEQEVLEGPSVIAAAVITGATIDEPEAQDQPGVRVEVAQSTTDEQEALDAPTLRLQVAPSVAHEQEFLDGPTLHLGIAGAGVSEQEALAGPTVLLVETIAPSVADETETLDGPTLHLRIVAGLADEQEDFGALLVGEPGPDQDIGFEDLLLDLSSDQPPTTLASGTWPDAIANARWRWTFTPAFASDELAAGFALLWRFDDGSDQVWLEGTPTLVLKAFAGGPICSVELTFSASQPITVEFDPAAGMVRIAGATTGNGDYAADSGPWTWPTDVPLHVGQTETGTLTFDGAFSDVTDPSNGPVAEVEQLDAPAIGFGLASGLADETESLAAPLITTALEAGALDEPEASDTPQIEQVLAAAALSQQEIVGAPVVGHVLSAGALAEPEALDQPIVADQVQPAATVEQEALAGPTLALVVAPAPASEGELLAAPTLHQAVAGAGVSEQELIAGMVLGDAVAADPLAEQEALAGPSLIVHALIAGAGAVEAETLPAAALALAVAPAAVSEPESLTAPTMALQTRPLPPSETDEVFAPAVSLVARPPVVGEQEALSGPALHQAIAGAGVSEQESIPAPIAVIHAGVASEQEAIPAPTLTRSLAPSVASEPEALGAPRLDRTLEAGELIEQEAPPAPALVHGLAGGALLDQEALGAPLLAQRVTQGALEQPESIGAPQVVHVLPAGALAEQEALGTPSLLAAGAITGAGVSEGETLPAAHLVQGLTAGELAEQEQTQARGVGFQFVDPSVIDEAEALDALALDYEFTAPLIDETESVAVPSLLGRITVGLINKRDTAEIVRDKIGQILALEQSRQQAQAITAGQDGAQWKLRVFLERTNPWCEFLDTNEAFLPPIVNVSLDSVTYDPAGSNIVERQKAIGTYHIDCYGYGVSAARVGGHDAGDEVAAREAQRAARLVRNILMAGEYTYLGMRGTVWKRWTQSITLFQPQLETRAVQHVAAARLVFEVTFNEFSPQIEPVPLGLLSVAFQHAPNGEVLLHFHH